MRIFAIIVTSAFLNVGWFAQTMSSVPEGVNCRRFMTLTSYLTSYLISLSGARGQLNINVGILRWACFSQSYLPWWKDECILD